MNSDSVLKSFFQRQNLVSLGNIECMDFPLGSYKSSWNLHNQWSHIKHGGHIE